MATKFTPLHDRILVRRVEEVGTTRGGIIIPDSAKDKPQEGEVISVGKGKTNDEGKVFSPTPAPTTATALIKFFAFGTTPIERLLLSPMPSRSCATLAQSAATCFLLHSLASSDLAHSPATCFVGTLSRFQTFVVAIQRSSEASAVSS